MFKLRTSQEYCILSPNSKMKRLNLKKPIAFTFYALHTRKQTKTSTPFRNHKVTPKMARISASACLVILLADKQSVQLLWSPMNMSVKWTEWISKEFAEKSNKQIVMFKNVTQEHFQLKEHFFLHFSSFELACANESNEDLHGIEMFKTHSKYEN